MKVKRYIYFLILLTLPLTGLAQHSARWLIQPGRYATIQPWSDGLLKVTNASGQQGLINTSGQEVLPTRYELTGVLDGLAYILTRTADHIVINGYVNEKGEVLLFKDNYYAIGEDYVFFHEGLMPVANANGKKGFIDQTGRLVIGMHFSSVLPFCEGLACAWDDSQGIFGFIDRTGTSIQIQLANGGFPCDGRSFYQGQGYVKDEDDWYVIDKSGTCRRIKEKIERRTPDYLGRVDATGAPTKPAYSVTATFRPNIEDTNLIPFTENGQMGYKDAIGNVVLPIQFNEAGQFIQSVAVVKTNSGEGLLKRVGQTGNFSVQAVKNSLTYSAGSPCTCTFMLNTPTEINTALLEMTLSADGKKIEASPTGKNSYSFKYTPSGREREESKDFALSLSQGGIKLWEGHVNYQFQMQTQLSISLSVAGTDANADGLIPVKAIIHNPNNCVVKATVYLRGSELFQPKTAIVEIQPGSNEIVTSYFKVTKAAPGQWVEATTSEGGLARKSGLELIPPD